MPTSWTCANPKAVTCWRTTLTSPEELLRDAFAISTMAETQDLWQNTENSSEFPYLYLRGTCLSLNVLGLRGGSQGQHLKQSHVPKASALGLTPQGKMCLWPGACSPHVLQEQGQQPHSSLLLRVFLPRSIPQQWASMSCFPCTHCHRHHTQKHKLCTLLPSTKSLSGLQTQLPLRCCCEQQPRGDDHKKKEFQEIISLWQEEEIL